MKGRVALKGMEIVYGAEFLQVYYTAFTRNGGIIENRKNNSTHKISLFPMPYATGRIRTLVNPCL